MGSTTVAVLTGSDDDGAEMDRLEQVTVICGPRPKLPNRNLCGAQTGMPLLELRWFIMQNICNVRTKLCSSTSVCLAPHTLPLSWHLSLLSAAVSKPVSVAIPSPPRIWTPFCRWQKEKKSIGVELRLLFRSQCRPHLPTAWCPCLKLERSRTYFGIARISRDLPWPLHDLVM